MNPIDDKQIQALLKKLDNLNPKNLESALKVIGNDQLVSVQDTFAAEGRPKISPEPAPSVAKSSKKERGHLSETKQFDDKKINKIIADDYKAAKVKISKDEVERIKNTLKGWT